MMGRRTVSAVIVSLSLLAVLSSAFAAVYIVGGDKNWIVPNGAVNYTEWANNVTARVGDSLYFKYNPNGHNVVKVNASSFAACHNKDYLQIWDTGDTTVVLQEPGMHYFMCGAPNHCKKLQAFSILVADVEKVGTPPDTTGAGETPDDNDAVPLSSSIVISVVSLILVAAFTLGV